MSVTVVELTDEDLFDHLMKQTKREVIEEYIQLRRGNKTLLVISDQQKENIATLKIDITTLQDEEDEMYKHMRALRKVTKALNKAVKAAIK